MTLPAILGVLQFDEELVPMREGFGIRGTALTAD
jgi:hypothetical protein